MRKQVLALSALSAMGGTALAQSSVTIYGVLDAPIEYVNDMARGTPTVVNNQLVTQPGGKRISIPTTGGLSAPRWGLRGKEDLGGGLAAIFTLEGGFGLDTGISTSGRLFGRQASVGFQSPYGKLTFGRQYTSIFEGFSNFTPTRYAVLYEPIAWQLGINYRSDNTIKYLGEFGPMTFGAHYSFGNGAGAIGSTPLAGGESPGNFRDNTGYGASVAYVGKTFGATLVYDEWNPTVTPGQPGRTRKFGGAVSYQTGPLKLTAGYRWNRTSFNNGNTFVRDDYWWTGATYRVMPALGLTLAYYYADLKEARLGATAPRLEPANPWQVTFIADYDLSKRTDIYLTTAYARNAGLNFDSSPVSFATGYFPNNGQKGMFGLAVGVRHRF
ncbi:Outer membrane protein (Porin) [Cupriavidus taiwanensis]|uniref:Outer membrane protein (Porin) n=1 Tax=Cupriavidus taiwanensis TaxID=164546 RepID=A0A976B0W7_9BURK|nr:porin [Cupriavidus taiwanensis]SOZ64616.1 Outer membrane protein (Porin) [Cupriavidus taiwanensis]SOZ65525.1 Outer membrane protein (Porin) [Cupriavidus taiwanensis]SOZ69110.1 Outer membrane protein (Porin) [Cupriavidus taiwanensis]SPA08362.1 Outer membrane protein (Porin) [Cupriavidus taiwanensis]SPA23100.1 Outer membrane protein (Porin) [Cupriavidus taiwanensis]